MPNLRLAEESLQTLKDQVKLCENLRQFHDGAAIAAAIQSVKDMIIDTNQSLRQDMQAVSNEMAEKKSIILPRDSSCKERDG